MRTSSHCRAEYERGCIAALRRSRPPETFSSVQHASFADDLRLAVSEFDRAGGEELIFTLGPPQGAYTDQRSAITARSLSVRLQFTDFLLALVTGQTRLMYEIRKQFSGRCASSRHRLPLIRPGLEKLPCVVRRARLLADLHEGPADAIGTLCGVNGSRI